MKGDFSRLTFDERKHYTTVLKQQGRVDVDADWNEQQAINRHHARTEAADVIGCCGAPQRAPGFHIVTKPEELRPEEKGLPGNSGITATQGADFFISAGRIYVDGILCENEKAVLFSQQPDLPSATVPPNESTAVIYLDVWQRHITALDDPAIREKALGGPDTATRLKTVWQVKILPWSRREFNRPDFVENIRTLAGAFKKIAEHLDPEIMARMSALKKSTTRLVKNRAAATAWSPTVREARTFLDNLVKLDLPVEARPIIATIIDPIRDELPPVEEIGCQNPPPEWKQLVAPLTGQMAARTSPTPPGDDPCCTLPPGAGYRGLENQLYRVEIHQGNVDANGVKINATPTFKWSRDNGSVVTAITGISGQTISVHDIGPDNELGFAVGQWVEVIDDTRELNGQCGDLVQITDLPPNSKKITVKGNLILQFDETFHPRLRRWDSQGDIIVETPATNNGWIPLEAGIEVQFPVQNNEVGTFKTGDYWLIPARTANSETTNDIEWPVEANGQPMARSPQGIRHQYCCLALLNITTQPSIDVGGPGTVQIDVVEDCRCIFPPLCKPKTEPAETRAAIRVDNVWFLGEGPESLVPNGAMLKAQRFREGIGITCDHPIDRSTISQATVFLTLDLPFPLFRRTVGEADADLWAAVFGSSSRRVPIIGFQPVMLDGMPSVNDENILWRPTEAAIKLLTKFNEMTRRLDVKRVLAHLTLKGRFIWAADNPLIYLDGQAFGAPDDSDVPNHLRLPSGDEFRGSDFEMWFWLVNEQ